MQSESDYIIQFIRFYFKVHQSNQKILQSNHLITMTYAELGLLKPNIIQRDYIY